MDFDKKIRNLLVNAKGVLKNEERASVKTISVVSKYNSNQELEYLEGHYVVNYWMSQAPFGFNLNIKKDKENYLIRRTIQSIYFHHAPDRQPRKMD